MEEYINFKFIVKSVWKKFYIVIFLGIVGFLVGYLYNQSLPITTNYNATAKIYVRPNYDNKNDTSYDTLIATDKIAQAYAELVKSRVVLEKVAPKLSFQIDTQDLMNRLTANPINNQSIITIGFVDANQDKAIEIVKTVYTVFLEDEAGLHVNNTSVIDTGSVSKISNSKRSIKYATMFTCVSILIGIIIAYGIEIYKTGKKHK